jgi:hypothetical protein
MTTSRTGCERLVLVSCERRESRARRAEEERADTSFVCERRRSRRNSSARCASSSQQIVHRFTKS